MAATKALARSTVDAIHNGLDIVESPTPPSQPELSLTEPNNRTENDVKWSVEEVTK